MSTPAYFAPNQRDRSDALSAGPEGIRIATVLDETLDELMFIINVSDRMLADANKYSDVLGKDLIKILSQQHQAETQYARLAQQGKEDSQLIRDATLALEDATRNLCRHMRRDESTSEAVSYVSSTLGGPSVPCEEFIRMFVLMKDLAYGKLLTTVEDERAKRKYIEEVIARESKVTAEKKALEKDLLAQKKERQKQTAKGDAQISKLQAELANFRKMSERERLLVEKQTTEERTRALEEHTKKAEMLEKQLNQLKQQLGGQVGDNKFVEVRIRKDKAKNEEDLEEIITRYDTEMSDIHDELSRLKSLYEEETKSLQHLQEYFDRLAEEEKKKEEENRIRLAILAEKERARVYLDRAATKVQAMYRGVLVRRVMSKKLEKLRKKNKKKGKKGKAGGAVLMDG